MVAADESVAGILTPSGVQQSGAGTGHLATTAEAVLLDTLGHGWFRTRDQIHSYFAGLRILDPGLRTPHADAHTKFRTPAGQLLLIGLAHKPDSTELPLRAAELRPMLDSGRRRWRIGHDDRRPTAAHLCWRTRSIVVVDRATRICGSDQLAATPNDPLCLVTR
ncbi:hypothetical protein ACTD5D_02220 [Nocardia takedensis]|uniref:hypothetical protein n=1 Tax=Nocardia TaxID=1817 RepID=UPI002457549E|nr:MULTISPECIES: hypothetical protein [Nocardia]